MTSLILIRHGQTDWNLQGRWQGQADPPLNARGRAQARAVADYLRGLHLDALYSSDLCRAQETAQEIARASGLELRLDRRLREIHLGKAEGMLTGEIQACAPQQFRLWYEAPLQAAPFGNEDIRALAMRVLQVLNEITARHREHRVAIVSHQLPIAVALCAAEGLGLEHFRRMTIPNGGYRKVVILQPLQIHWV